jgi:hypothetical protein
MENQMYKVIVPSDVGFSSIPLSLEEALEYAFECNTDCKILNLETGKFIDFDEEFCYE